MQTTGCHAAGDARPQPVKTTGSVPQYIGLNVHPNDTYSIYYNSSIDKIVIYSIILSYYYEIIMTFRFTNEQKISENIPLS